jgi:hypothetical protein
MYSVFTKLADGELLLIGSFNELKQASQLVKDLKENYHHEYLIRDSDGNNVDPEGI